MKKITLVVLLNLVLLSIALYFYRWISASHSKWEEIDQNTFRLINQLGIDFERLTIQTQLLDQKLNQIRVLFTLI